MVEPFFKRYSKNHVGLVLSQPKIVSTGANLVRSGLTYCYIPNVLKV